MRWKKNFKQNIGDFAKNCPLNTMSLSVTITDGWSSIGKDVWNKYYAPRGAYNYGIAGDQTQNVIWRIEYMELDGLNAKVVVLMIGKFF